MNRKTFVWRLSAILFLLVALPAALLSADGNAAAANVFVQHNLVSDIPGLADVTDPNLVNPWGMSYGATGPFWVSNNGKGNSTLYNGSGAITALVVTVPGVGGKQGNPTGQVSTNGVQSFLISNGRPASFIFDSEDGTITAWNGGTAAEVKVDNSGSGAVYKGLAIVTTGTPMLYAANFNSGNIDVFDGTFAPVKTSGGFSDASVPAGFAPFNIWNIGGKLYVTYAKQNSAKNADVAGAGNGYVAVFDTNGNLLKHLVSGGQLNSPWGVAIAPPTFGAFPNALLVGNFGDGTINAFDATAGTFLGTLQDANGKKIVNEGLWALLFGNGRNGGDPSVLYICAGISNGDTKVHGLLASIAPPAAVTGAINAASYASGGIAPGEAILLTGITIGPSPLVSAKIPTTGTLDTTVSSTSVTINGIPAPILFASASATSVMVPYGVAGSSTANIAVTYRDQTTATFQAPIAVSAPGVFTLNSSGTGAAVALNQDGSVNSAQKPATRGTVVVLFATGEGMTNPPGDDGTVTGPILHTPIQSVSLTIGGQNAQVVYAGSAPGLVEGIMQVEALVPNAAASGAAAVVLKVGGASSQTGVTINVQ